MIAPITALTVRDDGGGLGESDVAGVKAAAAIRSHFSFFDGVLAVGFLPRVFSVFFFALEESPESLRFAVKRVCIFKFYQC